MEKFILDLRKNFFDLVYKILVKKYPRSRSNRNTNTSSIVKSIQKGVGKNET